ncbi:3'-5' exonuclease [uncultured Mycolicibacterium sp.]|uniref:3'-5' exonuclease n=1 Tax=uncultured Mycolicibacterium sp. TaxID=2320817 RepID=UPI00261873D9|nr:3'-5' exonuclease [uncultured Mycolicibacterium sp.]
MDFIAVDFETANPRRASVCAVGWATVRGGRIVETGSWLCRPPAGYDEFHVWNVRVHRITPERVAGRPGFAELAPDLLRRIASGMPLVAHNAAFDRSVLAAALRACGHPLPPLDFHCTARLARRLLQLPDYRLPTVCGHLGIPLDNHHDAECDAVAAARVALRLAERTGARSIAELGESPSAPVGSQ